MPAMTTIAETEVAGEIAGELARAGAGGRARVGRMIIASADYYRRAAALAGFVKAWPDVDRLLAANGRQPDPEGFITESRRILREATGAADPRPGDQQLGTMQRLLWRSWYATVLANEPSTDREELASWLRLLHLASLREGPSLERALAYTSQLRPAVPIRFVGETKRAQPPTKMPRFDNRVAIEREVAELRKFHAKLGALYAGRLHPATKTAGTPAPRPAPKKKTPGTKRKPGRPPVIVPTEEPEALEAPWAISPTTVGKDTELRELLDRYELNRSTNIFQMQQAILSRIATLEAKRASLPVTPTTAPSAPSPSPEEK